MKDGSRSLALCRGFAFALLASCVLLGLLAAGASARGIYVTDVSLDSVLAFDSATGMVTASIKVGDGPKNIAITPDGTRAYVVNVEADSVSVIDTRTNLVVGEPIKVGDRPDDIAVAPDGRHVYVTNEGSKTISVIETATGIVQPIDLGGDVPKGIAIAPDGSHAYITAGTVRILVIDIRTNAVLGEPIEAFTPKAIAATPDGKRLYFIEDERVSVIDTTNNQVLDLPMSVGKTPQAIAIAPDGTRAYVLSRVSSIISTIDIGTNLLLGEPIKAGVEPTAIAIAPDSRHIYATNQNASSLSIIDALTNQVETAPVGVRPTGIAIVPDQPPVASFTTPRARPGVPVGFDASASSDPDGTIGTYAWAFGDQQGTVLSSPRADHVYGAPGTYSAKLTLTDNEGCSTAFIFTGQTASCNGGPLATQTRAIQVAFPGVRVRCPKSAKPRGCKFKLQAIAKKPRKGKRIKVQSAVAIARLKPGKSTIVSLKPNNAFRAKLARATSVLVLETKRVGASQTIHARRLKIVQ